jgi:hypothetical protein
MDGGELMSEQIQVPKELQPIEPGAAAAETRSNQVAERPAIMSQEPLEPFSASHERPPLPT